ncbi:MAG: ATP-binding protein [Anaerolineales bacterium]
MQINSEGKDSPAIRRLTAERRVVTILFTDVKGSTAMAENLDPEDWAEIMNEAFDYLTKPVIHYGGTVARLMGDSVLAFFGAPVAHEDDPLRAVLAGLEMIDGIQAFRKRLLDGFNLDFNIRVGINTGVAVVGEMGSALAGEYTAMGDAVNLAARMEESADPGAILITDETYRQVAPWIEVDSLGSLDVKGKHDPVPVYRVMGRKEIPTQARGIAGIRSTLVGREREIRSLKSVIGQLFAGNGQIFTLVGEAGLGKSRLIEELHSELEVGHSAEYLWIATRGISYEISRPYGMYVQALRQVCQIGDDEPIDILQSKVRNSFSALSLDQQSGIVNALDILLTVDHKSEESTTPIQGEAVKRAIFSSMLDIWTTKAHEQPVVLVLDDLHWADEASVELTMHLFQLATDVPILFVCAMRPHLDSPAWQLREFARQSAAAFEEFYLEPLVEKDSNQLIDNLLKISNLPGELRESILEKSEGNPFFLEEVVRTLIEKGIIKLSDYESQWQLAPNYEEFDIPDNLHALLLARIDRLDEQARLTLQMASVIGRIFSYQIILEIGKNITDLEGQLATLQQSGLIQVVPQTPELEYMFRHELTREAAYQSILKRQRRDYHRQVGEAIEILYAGNLAEEAYRLAYHYDSARDFQGALKYYQIAGRQSMKLFANQEASHYFLLAIQLALKLNVTNVQLTELYVQRGRALELINDFDQALDNYEELEELAHTRHDRSLELAALIPQATIYSTPNVKFNPQMGTELSRRALNLAIDLREYEAEAKALWSMMLILTYSGGDLEQAVTYGEQGLRIAKEHDLREVKAFIEHDLARPYMRSGRINEAWAAYENSQAYWREVDNLPMLADNLASLAESYYKAGEFEKSLSYAEEGRLISEEISNVWGRAYNSYVIGPICLEHGEFGEGMQALERTLELSLQANFAAGIIASQMFSSWLYSMLGDLGPAKKLESQIGDFVKQYQSFEPLLFVNQAQYEMYAGHPEKALEIFNQVGSDYSIHSELFFHPFIFTLHVEILLRNRDYESALQIGDHYLDYQDRNAVKILVPDLLNQKARALIGLGEHDRAYQFLLEGRLMASKQGSRRILWAILLDLAELEKDKKLADEMRAEARQIVSYISAHISDPELLKCFRNLPGVRKLG